jgi:hypothetical protein
MPVFVPQKAPLRNAVNDVQRKKAMVRAHRHYHPGQIWH